ncbi:hypothetical protein [Falsiroseomonas sp. E2-1-a20]|uniref:hypothetical protein n=1 Tax=Falsiroseomonas sp. E2-1-a20 TaxID=3239300 RepID=UPI003F3555AD
MTWSVDARIPLLLLADATAAASALRGGPPAALLLEAGLDQPPGPVLTEARFQPQAGHGVACACCTGRSEAALALDRLFQARVRGQCGWFERVVAVAITEAGRLELTEALAGDRLVAARYRAG